MMLTVDPAKLKSSHLFLVMWFLAKFRDYNR